MDKKKVKGVKERRLDAEGAGAKDGETEGDGNVVVGSSKLWGGRFKSGLDPRMELFNASIHFDRRMWKEDIEASVSYANCLKQVNLLTDDECHQIVKGLGKVHKEWKDNSFILRPGDEDIHSANERRLKELIGTEIGGKLHTGRSRNDQVATDLRLWLRSAIDDIAILVKQLIRTMVERAEENLSIVFPGYTHLQRAQPLLWSHWILSYAWMLNQDQERLMSLRSRVNVCPLGSGAIAGNPFPIDRNELAASLKFQSVSCNSIHAVSDRDFVAEFLFWSSLVAVHLSRLAEDLILYSSHEFAFVSISDSFSTGSSLMPQKKNADSLELIRGKTGRLIGHSTGFLTVLKGLPSSFNKDLQEDKEPLFDAVDTIQDLMTITRGVIATLEVRSAECSQSLSSDLLATDIAYWLVRRGMAFREAHEVTGRVVAMAEQLGCDLSQVPVQQLRSISEKFTDDIKLIWNHHESVEQYQSKGGTSTNSVLQQIQDLKDWLDKN